MNSNKFNKGLNVAKVGINVVTLLLAMGSIFFGEGKVQSIYHFLSWFFVIVAWLTVILGGVNKEEDKQELTNNMKWYNWMLTLIGWSVYLYLGWYALFTLSALLTLVICGIVLTYLKENDK